MLKAVSQIRFPNGKFWAVRVGSESKAEAVKLLRLQGDCILVRSTGLEPAHLSVYAPQAFYDVFNISIKSPLPQ